MGTSLSILVPEYRIDESNPVCCWNNDDVLEWLDKLGLQAYKRDFRRYSCNGRELLGLRKLEIRHKYNLKFKMHMRSIRTGLHELRANNQNRDWHKWAWTCDGVRDWLKVLLK